MDSPREEFPRVSVDTQQDWQRIRANFTQAVYARLDERLALNNLTGQRSLFADHAQQVLSLFSCCHFKLTYPDALLTLTVAYKCDIRHRTGKCTRQRPESGGFKRGR